MIVIGADIAGLAAARLLKQSGIELIVLEMSSRVGGRVLTENVSGFKVNAGPQFMESFYKNTFT